MLARKTASYCFEVGLVDVGRVVGDRRRPRAVLLAHLLDGARGDRDRRVHEPVRPCRAPAPCAAASASPAPSRAAPPASRSRARDWASGSAARATVGGGGGTTSARPRKTCSKVTALAPVLSHFVYHASRPAFSSSRVSTPSLLASSRGNRRGVPAGPPGPRRAGRRLGLRADQHAHTTTAATTAAATTPVARALLELHGSSWTIAENRPAPRGSPGRALLRPSPRAGRGRRQPIGGV